MAAECSDDEESVGIAKGSRDGVRGSGWIGSLAEHWQCKHARLNRLRTCADAVSDLKWFAVTACT